MTYACPFNTKEEYLAYRKMWKAEYKTLTQTIREAKRCNYLYQRAWSMAERKCHVPGQFRNFLKVWNLQEQFLADDQEYQELRKKLNTTNWKYWTYPPRTPLKEAATRMLEELKGAKVEAQRQYMEQHQLVEA